MRTKIALDPPAVSVAEKASTIFALSESPEGRGTPYLDRLAQHHMPVDSNDVDGLSIIYISTHKQFAVSRNHIPASPPPSSHEAWRTAVVQVLLKLVISEVWFVCLAILTGLLVFVATNVAVCDSRHEPHGSAFTLSLPRPYLPPAGWFHLRRTTPGHSEEGKRSCLIVR